MRNLAHGKSRIHATITLGDHNTLERLQTTREDQATLGASGFGREYDVSTPAGALAALPTGLVYLLFSPFPWAVASLRQALVLPETLVWYGLMPSFVRGLRYAVKNKLAPED